MEDTLEPTTFAEFAQAQGGSEDDPELREIYEMHFGEIQ